MPVIIWKISHHDRANRTLTQSPEGYKNVISGIHYPTYYTATCQNEKITSHSVSFYNFTNLFGEIVHPRRWRRLATGYAGVDSGDSTGILVKWYDRRESKAKTFLNDVNYYYIYMGCNDYIDKWAPELLECSFNSHTDLKEVIWLVEKNIFCVKITNIYRIESHRIIPY